MSQSVSVEHIDATMEALYGLVGALWSHTNSVTNTNTNHQYRTEITYVNAPPNAITVINGAIINISRYYNDYSGPFFDKVPNDGFINQVLRNVWGRDGTRDFARSYDLIAEAACLRQRYQIGWVDDVTIGCFLAQVVFVLIILVVGILIVLRFIMSLWFHWSISPGRSFVTYTCFTTQAHDG